MARVAYRRVIAFILAGATAAILGCAPAAQPSAQPAPGAEQKPQYGGVFVTHRAESDTPSFDAHRENTFNLMRPLSSIWDNVVRYSPEDRDKIVPDLAEKWDFSQDGKTLTFSIRKGVKFHSGDPLTATDIKFTLDRIRGVVTQGPGALANSSRKDLLRSIDRIETPDGTTVVLRLKSPQASLLEVLTDHLNPVYSKTWVEAGHDLAKEVNGTGPFKFKEYIRGTSTEVVKNESYWNPGLPYLDGIKTYIIPDSSTALAALRTGQMMFMTMTAEQETTLRPLVEKGEVPLDLIRVPAGRSGASLFLNTTRKPFDDPRVRKAVTLATNREDFLKLTGRDGSVVAGWVIPGSFWGLPPGELEKIPGYKKDKEAERAEARKLLAEAGYPSGLTVKGMTRTEQNYIDTAIRWADQLGKVGITLKIEPVDLSIAYERFAKYDYEAGPFGAGAGTTPDPDTFYGQFILCGSPRNYSGWCDSKFEELYSRQQQALDPVERRKIVWEIEKYVLEQAPTLPGGVSSPSVWAVNKQVRGWIPQYSEYNHSRLDTVWLAR
ncbi:MAG: hypothetical protein HYY02_12280 [Chloroflexi bacterium]|nr:hypothetical protein [Chloroflexota bacterium]